MTWKTLAVSKPIAPPGDERVALQLSPSTSNSFEVVPILLALLLLVGPMRSATAAELGSVEADGTEFKVTVSDGTVLFSPDLVGAQLVIAVAGQRVQLRIVAVERDPDAKQGEVWLHTFSTQANDGSWRNPCEAGPDGRRQGFPLAGRLRMPDGLFEPAEPGTFELTCTSGAQGKCVRIGYLPWGGEDALALYNACVRMMRADYCGDGEPHTRAGTPIEIYDNTGSEGNEPFAGMELEAAWGPQGAVCVHHVRISEIFSLDKLKQSCPRLKPEDLGAGCTEERMSRGTSALLMNKSYTK